MPTLLKDLPECMEKIENNQLITTEVKEILSDVSDYSESRGEYVIGDSDFDRLSSLIIEKLTDFVNQNYEWKGVKK